MIDTTTNFEGLPFARSKISLDCILKKIPNAPASGSSEFAGSASVRYIGGRSIKKDAS
jgi:hypothetical protein